MTLKYLAGNKITGLSTDSKPTNQTEGSVFTETDTLVISDYTSGAWVARAAGGGGTGAFASIVKGSDETRQSTSTLADDADLVFTPAINKSYSYVLQIYYNTHTLPQYKSAFSVPSGCTATIQSGEWKGDGVSQLDFTSSRTQAGNSDDKCFTIYGRFVMSSTAGDIAYQWAGNGNYAFDTTVQKGSRLTVWESA